LNMERRQPAAECKERRQPCRRIQEVKSRPETK
jgi:hypothetical protein